MKKLKKAPNIKPAEAPPTEDVSCPVLAIARLKAMHEEIQSLQQVFHQAAAATMDALGLPQGTQLLGYTVTEGKGTLHVVKPRVDSEG